MPFDQWTEWFWEATHLKVLTTFIWQQVLIWPRLMNGGHMLYQQNSVKSNHSSINRLKMVRLSYNFEDQRLLDQLITQVKYILNFPDSSLSKYKYNITNIAHSQFFKMSFSAVSSTCLADISWLSC